MSDATPPTLASNVLRLTELASRTELHVNSGKPNYRNTHGCLVLIQCRACGCELARQFNILRASSDQCLCGWSEQKCLRLTDAEMHLFRALSVYITTERS